MPRLSLWKGGTHSSDYKFIDRRISEIFTISGTGILLHKYLGPVDQGESGDVTKPSYDTQSELNIQDLLFLENRDRKYDTDVYTMRGIYQRSDHDFDLSQFGLFISNDTLFMVFHLNDMVETMGRKIMNGDVIELLHLKDFHNADDSVPAALKRYYVAGDCSWATEGFSQTWFPHLWRVKFTPLVDSQEYKDILNKITVGQNNSPLVQVSSTFDKYLDINEAIVQQAEVDVPKSGYDTTKIYTKPLQADGALADQEGVTADNYQHSADENITADDAGFTPSKKVKGYLSGDGTAPNGLPVGAGVAFPGAPAHGDFYLRLDYMPNRLFRFDGRRWVKVEDSVRASLGPGNTETLHDSFVNNANTYTTRDGEVRDERQSLSKALGLKPDL